MCIMSSEEAPAAKVAVTPAIFTLLSVCLPWPTPAAASKVRRSSVAVVAPRERDFIAVTIAPS